MSRNAIRSATAIVVFAIAPVLNGVDPTQGCRGTTLELTISGSNIQPGAVVTFTPSTGITIVAGPTVSADGTSITLTIAIASNAPLGPVSITVTNLNGGATTLAGAFTVIAGVTVPTGYFGTAVATQDLLQFPIGLDVGAQDDAVAMRAKAVPELDVLDLRPAVAPLVVRSHGEEHVAAQVHRDEQQTGGHRAGHSVLRTFTLRRPLTATLCEWP